MRRSWLAAALAASLWGQIKLQNLPPGALDPRTRTVVDLARAVLPEFAADAFLQISESGAGARSDARVALLQEAFQTAANAQEKVGLRRVYGGGPYSDVGVAELQGMDGVSLRARAVHGMLGLNPRLAAEMFDRITLPVEPISDCRSPVVYDLSAYYKVMSEVLGSTSDPGQVDAILQRHIAGLRSSAQVQPLAQALQGFHGSPDRLSGAVLALAAQLPRLADDSPEFSASFSGAIRALGELGGKFPAGSNARRALVQGSRSWVVNGASHGLCMVRQRTMLSGGNVVPAPVESPVARFNQEMAPLLRASAPVALGQNDVKFVPPGPPAGNSSFSSAYLQLYRVHQLLAGDDSKGAPRWRAEMDRFLTSLFQWKGDGLDATSYYLEKSQLLRSAMVTVAEAAVIGSEAGADITSRVSDRRTEVMGPDRVRRALLEFLQTGAALDVWSRRRLNWFGPVAVLLADRDSGDGEAMLGLFAAAHNPVLTLYGRLGSLLTDDAGRRGQSPREGGGGVRAGRGDH